MAKYHFICIFFISRELFDFRIIWLSELTHATCVKAHWVEHEASAPGRAYSY